MPWRLHQSPVAKTELGGITVYPKMLIGLEGAHAFYVSIFDGIEHLRDFQWSEPPKNPLPQWRLVILKAAFEQACHDAALHLASRV